MSTPSEVRVDQIKELQIVSSIDAALVAAAGTTTGDPVDCSGFRSATAFLSVGTVTDGTHVITLQESDASGSGFADVATADLVGGAQFVAPVSDTDQAIGYQGSKRYLKVKDVVTGGATGAQLAAVIILGRPRSKPTTATLAS